MTSKRLLSLLLLASAVAAPAAALADTVGFTLLNPVQSGPEGSVFTYQATVSAPLTNTGAEYLNGVSETTSGGPLTVDDSDFFNEFPTLLNPGDSYTGDIFTMMATAGSAGTTTTGTIVLQGGPMVNDFDQLGQADFAATSAVTVAATPEPSSLLLLASGAMGGFAVLRRRRGQPAIR